jgi:hypothetical protein
VSTNTGAIAAAGARAADADGAAGVPGSGGSEESPSLADGTGGRCLVAVKSVGGALNIDAAHPNCASLKSTGAANGES